jgi:hypothetical protein
LPAESVARRKCIGIPSDFHGLHRRFGRSRCAIARAVVPGHPEKRASQALLETVPGQASMRPDSAVEEAVFDDQNADMLDPNYNCIEIEKWYLPKFLFSYSSK